MSTSVDPAAIRAALTGAGGPFELHTENVRGIDLPVWSHRRRALREWLVESAAFGDREYLVQGDQRITYAQHLDAVTAQAEVFANDYGVRQGDRVAILAANSPEWVIAFWAAVSLGAIAVAGNAWWTPREAAYSLGRAEPKVVLADKKRMPLVDGTDAPVVQVGELPLTGGGGLPDVRPDEDAPAVIVYTSGTTGHPKGAVQSQRNLLAVIEYHRYTELAGRELAAAFGMPAPPSPKRFLMTLPLFHIASLHNLAIPRLAIGDTVVMDSGRFDVDNVLGLIEQERITNWAVVPTMAHRVAEHDGLERYDLSSLSALSINSAPSSPALKDRVRAAVPSVQTAIADSYGLTESSTAATVATPLDLMMFPTSVGLPIPSVDVSIRGASGELLPDGAEGEIWLRSQFTMLGYWRAESETEAVLSDDGWLRTGDLGSLRAGRLYMATRRTDLILRGGENVYPAEIEAVLDEHPAVEECAVFGVDDPDLGQAVAVVVVCRDVDEAALRTFVAERLAYYKVPAHWKLTQTPLTRTATGKVIRRTLAV